MSVAAISSERTESDENVWTRRLVLFLRVMAVISVIKGLYHWAQVTGFIGSEEDAFENQPMAWQTATVYFAVIELVAAVGLWLATPWGAVVWLTTVVTMGVIELMFPAIYGGSLAVVGGETLMLGAYLALAWMAARERPP
jgi:fatty acid desaturase